MISTECCWKMFVFPTACCCCCCCCCCYFLAVQHCGATLRVFVGPSPNQAVVSRSNTCSAKLLAISTERCSKW